MLKVRPIIRAKKALNGNFVANELAKKPKPTLVKNQPITRWTIITVRKL